VLEQAAHSFEEYAGRLWETFPTAPPDAASNPGIL
jgi:hypothetical protein